MKDPSQDHPGIPAGRSAHLQAEPVADGVVARFQHIQAVLAPVIGYGGVVALYERSRHLSSRFYPWLAPSQEGLQSGMNLDDLKSRIAQQHDEAAAAGASFLLKSFDDLLAGLMGEDLTLEVLGFPSEYSPNETP